MIADEDATSRQQREAGGQGRSDRPWSVLTHHPDFRRLFVGNTISLLGSSVTAVALPLTAVVYLHASATQMGVLGAVSLLPHLVLGLPAGVWVDRMPYRRVLVLADLAQTLLLGSIPVLALLGVLEIWHLFVVAVLAGICNLFDSVAAQSFIPSLVTRDQLLPANSALMMSTATVNTTGSALGGVLVTLLTAPVAIAADAVSFLLAGLCKARIRNRGLTLATTRPRASRRRQHLWAEIWYGLRVVFTHPILRAVTVAATVGALAGQMQGVVLVLFLVRDLGLSSALVGIAIAASGVAAILGALITTRLSRRLGPGRTFIAGTFIASVAGLVLAAVSGPLFVALAILMVAQVLRGIGPSLYGVNQQTFRQALVAPSVLSRVNATWRFLVHGMQVFGALLGGLAGSALGLRTTIIISSGAMLAGTVVACVSPLRSLRDLPAPPTGEPSAA